MADTAAAAVVAVVSFHVPQPFPTLENSMHADHKQATAEELASGATRAATNLRARVATAAAAATSSSKVEASSGRHLALTFPYSRTDLQFSFEIDDLFPEPGGPNHGHLKR